MVTKKSKFHDYNNYTTSYIFSTNDALEIGRTAVLL